MIYKVQEEVPVEESYATTVDYTEYGSFQGSTTLNITVGSNVNSYTTKADDDDADSAKSITSVVGTTNTETNRVLFTNTRSMNPETGIHLDILPYVLILAVAVAACVVLIVCKKRKAAR
jgi:hypothetical protein